MNSFKMFLMVSVIGVLGTLMGCTSGCASHSPSPKSEAPPTAETKGDKMANPVVIVETSLGEMEIELWEDKAPETVKNFLQYVDDGFYSGTIFHRVINGFMIQGGGFTEKMEQKPTRTPVKNEARADVPNTNGTVAMARTNIVDSATAQFFINVKDNDFLNHRGKSADAFGYAVFGRVVSGSDTVDKIKAVPTTYKDHYENVPVTPVVIKNIKRK